MTLPFPTDALAQHIAILGKTGAGKSFLSRAVVEWLLDQKRRVCIIDPTGVHWGIRLEADGKTPSGYDVVIFGGKHADLPFGQNHGEALAEIIGASNTSAIIDTSLMTVGERTRFFADFGEALLRKNKGPIHVIIDEAHVFAPQGRVADPQSGRMLHAANNLVSLGRGRGFAFMLLSQRPAKLHKDSLTQAETLVALRLIAPQDRSAVEAWIGEWADPKQGREIIASLPSLKRGQGWVWSPELGVLEQVEPVKIRTYDSFKASHEEPDLAPINIAEVAERLEEAAHEAFESDPGRLRKRVAELERQLAAASDEDEKINTPDPAAIDRAREEGYRAGLDAGRAEGFEAGFALAKGQALETIERSAADVRRAVMEISLPLEDGGSGASPEPAPDYAPDYASPLAIPEVDTRAPLPAAAPPKSLNSRATGALPAPQQRILEALAWWGGIGIAAPTRQQVGWLAGYSAKGSTFETYLSRMRGADLISYPSGGTMSLTAAGRSAARKPEKRLTTAIIQDVARQQLASPLWRILEPLLRIYPKAVTRAELAAMADYSAEGSTFETYLSRLRSLGLIGYPERGRVVALPVLFVEGKR